jgi:hypothetical protein
MCAPPASTSVSSEATATAIRLASFTEHLLPFSAGDLGPRPPQPFCVCVAPVWGMRVTLSGDARAPDKRPSGLRQTA